MISNAENLRRVLRGEKPDRIPVECWFDPRGDGAYTLIPYKGAHAPSAGGYDLWGVRWIGTGEHLPYPVEHPAATVEEALAMPFPNIHNPALWAEPQEKVEEAIKGESVPIAWQPGGLWERYWFLLGLETALVSLLDQPESASALLQRIADWQIEAANHFIDIGIEVARISDDYGSQTSLLMSPTTWRQLIRPQLTRIVEHYQQADIPVILHSCGNLTHIMDDLIELKFSAFNIQTNANDLVALRRRYGRRFCLWGGISTQDVLSLGTPTQIKETVRQVIRSLGLNGGLILEPDQLIAIPDENIQAFVEAAQEMQATIAQVHQ